MNTIYIGLSAVVGVLIVGALIGQAVATWLEGAVLAAL